MSACAMRFYYEFTIFASDSKKADTMQISATFDNEDDEMYILVITISAPMGFKLDFTVSNGELYTPQEYEDFAEGKLNELEFNDMNGYCGFWRKAGKVTFQVCHHGDGCSFELNEEHCTALFTQISAARREFATPEAPTFTELGAKKVELFVGDGKSLWMSYGNCRQSLPGFWQRAHRRHSANLGGRGR